MKHKGIKLAILGVLLFGSGLGIFSNNFRSIILPDEKIALKSAKHWDLTGNPISIDDSHPGKNWLYTVSNYDWCSGSGNWTDPYLIENVTIDGQDSGSCIEIMNSNAYFIIRNCTLFYAGYLDGGISLLDTRNGRLIDNYCWGSHRYGIYLYDSYNNTLSGNIANDNVYGIYIDESDDNTLSGNIAILNIYGISLYESHDNTLSGNTASYNSEIGIRLDGSDHNTLSGNTVNINWNGIRLTNSHDNILSGNIASDNDTGEHYSQENGIVLDESDHNMLSGNIASNNDYGIWLYYSDYNTLSGNTLLGNTECILETNCQGNTLENNNCNKGDGIITGYNLFFLLGILSVVAIFICKKVKKS